jgi:hypothetical protein
MFVEKYLVSPEKFFLVCPEKNFDDLPQFWGEILMFSLPVRANNTVPPQTRLGPYAHASAVALHQGIKQVLLLFNLCYVIKSCQTYFHE